MLKVKYTILFTHFALGLNEELKNIHVALWLYDQKQRINSQNIAVFKCSEYISCEKDKNVLCKAYSNEILSHFTLIKRYICVTRKISNIFYFTDCF